MPNKNYEKGKKKEYRVRDHYVRMGYIVLRTAGSHGFADLIAIHPESKSIRFIQCKPDKFSDFQKKKLLKENKFCNGTFYSEFLVI